MFGVSPETPVSSVLGCFSSFAVGLPLVVRGSWRHMLRSCHTRRCSGCVSLPVSAPRQRRALRRHILDLTGFEGSTANGVSSSRIRPIVCAVFVFTDNTIVVGAPGMESFDCGRDRFLRYARTLVVVSEPKAGLPPYWKRYWTLYPHH